jgi:hypothetical protein
VPKLVHVLLRLDDTNNMEDFQAIRKKATVSLVVAWPQKSVQWVLKDFFFLGFEFINFCNILYTCFLWIFEKESVNSFFFMFTTEYVLVQLLKEIFRIF